MTGEQKAIAILGSTGSIGRQALEVVAAYPERFAVQVLAAGNQADLLIEQALAFRPQQVVIGNEAKYEQVKAALQPQGISVATGATALEEAVQHDTLDMVLVALVGYAGLKPTISAIRAGKDIALANKETLVVAGELVTQLAAAHEVAILPVDSEHSAIFQCLAGEQHNAVEKIILTASGGPFRGKKAGELATVTREQALRHPNWEMGAKITIDSATLMNKGLEVIEAHWLFGMQRQQIEVVVHPQSIIHSLVQFEDGSIKAQMGLPDMKLPIQYALTYPERLKTTFPRFNFAAYPALTFEQPDLDTFRNLALAYESMDRGGNMPCVLNAANEVAVEAFLQDKIGFLDMPELIATCLAKIPHIEQPDLNDYVETDKETRIKAQELIK
ncbi:MAG TPA: 1-deoxy-D-xylulose-5-phosphate reductoisomerase [Flammeovirgaceae bacterium]|nr:1-deoxy-D-xylulose-5-phosphate reductoisomerase [Flammeovirgaceae bacterium]